jgi:hypothetical protein
MSRNLEGADILRLLREYEQISNAGGDASPTVAVIAAQTRLPQLDEVLRSELLEKQRPVEEVAQLITARLGSPARDLIDRGFIGALYGIAVALGTVGLVGFMWGGVTRAAPCGSAPDFLAGGLFAASVLTVMVGVPLAAVTSIIGAIIATVARWDRTPNRI